MFTLKNPNLIALLGEQVDHNVAFRQGTALGKLINVGTIGADSTTELLGNFDKDHAHEAYMSDLENQIRSIIGDEIRFIRNTVSSVIEDVHQLLEDKVATLVPKGYKNQVIQARVPEFLLSEELVGMVSKYETASVKDVTFSKNVFPSLTSQELLSIMNTIDDPEMISMVNGLVDSTSTNLVDIYNKWFRNDKASDYPRPGELTKPSYTPFIYTERAIAYLLAVGFYKNTHPDVNLDLATYTSQLSVLAASLGKQLFQNLTLVTNLANTGKLLVSVEPTSEGRNVIVRGRVYDKFLELQDATPDTLLALEGTYRTQLNNLTLEVITNEDLGDLVAKANVVATREANYHKSLIQNQRMTYILKELMLTLSSIIDEEKYVLPEGKSKAEVLNACRVVAKDFGNFSMDSMYYMVRNVVCTGLYPNSTALTYLKAMDQYQKQNPNITAREAATLATRDALVEWSVNQLA